MKFEMKRGLALLLCLAMVVGVFVGVPGMTTVADAVASITPFTTVENGDFESVTANHFWTLSDEEEVQVVSGAGRTGAALYINAKANNARSTAFEVQPGTSITASVWTKGTCTIAQLYFWWYTDADCTTAASTAKKGTNWKATPDEWTETTFTQTVPSDAKYAQITLNTGGSAEGEVYFDDLSVKGTKANAAGTNLLGYYGPQNYNTTGLTTTYDEATDTATMTVVSQGSGDFFGGSFEQLEKDNKYFLVNATYCVEFDLNVVSTNSETANLLKMYVQQRPTSGSNKNLVSKIYTAGNVGSNSFEFTPDTTFNQLRFYVQPSKNGVNATFSISNLTVYAKCGDVVNGSFDESVINVPNWTFSDNADTSWAVSTGNESNTGITITDNNSSKNMVMTSGYIEIPDNYWRQQAYITVDAKSDSTCGGLSIGAAYYDADYQAVTSTETWSGGGVGSTWDKTNSDSHKPNGTWATYGTRTNSMRYIPYGAKYMQITISMGTTTIGTATVDNVTLSLRCNHVNGTHANPATEAESKLEHNPMVAPTYEEEGVMEYYECSICGVKYAEDTATTVITDTAMAPCEVRANVRMGNYLSLAFGLNTADLEAIGIDPATVTAEIEFGGTTETVAELAHYVKNDKDIYYAELSNIAAKEMYKSATANFYKNGETEPFATKTASIRSYVADVFKDESKHSTEWVKCCIDMVNYGAAAQNYFNYNNGENGTLANKGWEDKDSGTTFTSDQERTKYVGGDDFIGSNIRFLCNLTMLFAVKADSGAVRAEITYTKHNATETTTREAFTSWTQTIGVDDAICFEFDGMVVADLNQDITIKVYDAVGTEIINVTDSMDAYIGRVAESSDMYELAQAFGKFGTSAHTYLHKDDEV